MTASDDELLSDAPLLSAWHSYHGARPVSFTIPGHKGAAGQLWSALGTVLATDVPLFGGIDTVKLTAGVLADAESRAARLWGGDWCRFSTAGSTHAAQVLALSVGTPGDRVLVSRSAHRSMLSGLVLAGLTPVWLPTTVDDRFGVPCGVSVAAMHDAMEANPSARGVFLVEPSYLGTVSDLPALVGVAHAADLPVVVDQAWGAHFGFHPALPPHALECDADAMVFSAHKTLPAYSQASVIVACTQRLDRHRLNRAFDLANTTSPAGSILASIDGARALLAARGTELLDRVVSVVARARDCLRDIAGLVVPTPTNFPPGRLDPTKLVLLVAGTGGSGVAVEQDLLHAGIPVEMADHDTVVPIVTIADTDETVSALVQALRAAIERHRGRPRPVAATAQFVGPAAVTSSANPAAPPLSVAAMTPRDAFFAPQRTVDAEAAIGQVSAELVATYPPGIPVLVPGEVITAGALLALRSAAALGTRIAYAADPTLATLQVVDSY